MSDQAARPARPLSPWAQRYGVSVAGDLGDGSDHSLLNPIVPDVDPIFYDDIPGGNPQIPRLDKLLQSRRKQVVSHILLPATSSLYSLKTKRGSNMTRMIWAASTHTSSAR